MKLYATIAYILKQQWEFVEFSQYSHFSPLWLLHVYEQEEINAYVCTKSNLTTYCFFLDLCHANAAIQHAMAITSIATTPPATPATTAAILTLSLSESMA